MLLHYLSLTTTCFIYNQRTLSWEVKSENWYTDAPWLTVGLCLNKPIVNWKYHKLKRHLIHLTYWTAELSTAGTECTWLHHCKLDKSKSSNHSAGHSVQTSATQYRCRLHNVLVSDRLHSWWQSHKITELKNFYCLLVS